MAAELAVLAFVMAQSIWPRGIPEAVGWTIYFGTYPWSFAWLALDYDIPAATMAILSLCFAFNVTLVAALAWYAVARRNARTGPAKEAR